MMRFVRPLSVLALAGALSACVSLFPKTQPSTLYKLAITPAAAKGVVAAPRTEVTIRLAPTEFSRAALGDRILTTTGVESAYIAGARWVAPVQLLFDEEMQKAFDAASPGVRLATRGEPASTDLVLRVEVRTFEARYGADPKAAPTVVVEARATLTNPAQRAAVGEKLFHTEQAVTDNRVGPIVEAYNAATSQMLADLVSWTQGQAAGAKR